MTVEAILPWVLSAVTIALNLLAGNKHPKTWLFGIAGQGLWFAWIVIAEQWGFLVLAFFLTAVYMRNHIKWRREC